MTAAEILAILADWQVRMQALEASMDKLRDLTGCAPESPLGEAIYYVAGGYTNTVARQIGWSEDCLMDWWLTHDFGERPMRAGFSGEPMREISTIEQLAEFIAADAPEAA